MGVIGLIMIGSAVLMFAMGILMVKYTQFVASKMIDRKHMAADVIVHTGTPPTWWCRFMPRWSGASPLIKKRVMRRLKSTIRYFNNTPLIIDEQARSMIVTELEATYERWKSLSWHQIRNFGSEGR